MRYAVRANETARKEGDMNVEDRVTQLEAEVEVLIGVVQGLLGLLPVGVNSPEAIASVTRRLHAEAETATPGRKEALELAMKRVSPMTYARPAQAR